MFRRDWSLKPNGGAYEDLVFKQWWTNADGKTATSGTFTTRGFLGDYEIEVSSPGIDRPLTRLADFTRWKGHEAKIELNAPVTIASGAGRKRFRGMLEGLDGNDVVIASQGARIQFPFRSILEAKLVLTDKLIQEDLKARKAQ